MKKQLFIFTLLLILIPAVCAQNYKRLSVSSNTNTTIIRSDPYRGNAVICYSKDNHSGYIEYRTDIPTTLRVPIPVEYEIKDMRIYKNLLYLCGHHGIDAFIAVMDLRYFYQVPYTTMPPTIIYSYLKGPSGEEKIRLNSIEKMVVYSDNPQLPMTDPTSFANEDIVAIALNNYDPSYPQKVAIHIKFNNLGVNITSLYSTALPMITLDILHYTPMPDYLELEDVMLTENYISLVSYNHTPHNEAYYINKLDIGSPISSIYNTTYIYSAPDYEALSSIKGVGLSDNHIELATLALKDVANSTFEIRMRNIALTTMLMTNSQSIYLDNNKHDIDMIFNNSTNKIVSLMYYRPSTISYDVHSFFEIDPWATTSYSASTMYDFEPTHYSSFDPTQSVSFVASSYNKWFRKDLPLNPSPCHLRYPVQINQINNITFEIDEPIPLTITSLNKLEFIWTATEFVNTEIDCESE